MWSKTKNYLVKVGIWKRKMIGKRCEDLNCGHIFSHINEMQFNHIIPRTHGHGIDCGREGGRICCKIHGSPEDRINGRPTTPGKRRPILLRRYGRDAVEYYDRELWAKKINV